jgi:Dockerin type I domain
LRPGDLDGNACVDQHDLLILLAAVHEGSDDVVSYDFNGDDRVNARDVASLVRLFSRPLGLACR